MIYILYIYISAFVIGTLALAYQYLKYNKYHNKSIIKANDYGAYYLRRSRRK